MLEKIQETVNYIQSRINCSPIVGIILGTGLGGLVKEIIIHHELDYHNIPNFPISTVKGHNGKLIFGSIGGKDVVAMQGRFHYYEGWTMQEIIFPLRVMKLLGVESVFVSNAAGGVNSDFEIGDMMIITDHINLFPDNPLRGVNIEELGTRFPDMSEAYDKVLIKLAMETGLHNNFPIRQGVYAGVSGPTFETPSEYKYLQIIGADAVGMSTVPEVIAARHMNMRCFAMSIITDLGVAGKIVEVTHQEVLLAAEKAEPKMTLLFKDLIASL